MNLNRDLRQLRILSVFYYILALCSAFFACFPFPHLIVGISILTGIYPIEEGPSQEFPFPPRLVYSLMFIIIPLIFIIFGATLTTFFFLAGRSLVRQKHYQLCLIAAALISIFLVPLGTVLGIFTLIVLSRSTVRDLFNGIEEPNSVEPISDLSRNNPDSVLQE